MKRTFTKYPSNYVKASTTSDTLNDAIANIKSQLDADGLRAYYKLTWTTMNGDYGISLLLPWSITSSGKLSEWAEFEYNLFIGDRSITDTSALIKKIANKVRRNEEDIIDSVELGTSDDNDRAYNVILQILDVIKHAK